MVYSFGPVTGMYGCYGGMGNAYQNMKARYGYGHSDFGHSPIPDSYPFEIPHQHYEPPKPCSKFMRFLHKCFG